MFVAIFLLMYMTSILLPFVVPIQEFATFVLRKKGITSRCPFSFHDAKKMSYVLFCDNCTAFKVCPYMHINQFICFLKVIRARLTENIYWPAKERLQNNILIIFKN